MKIKLFVRILICLVLFHFLMPCVTASDGYDELDITNRVFATVTQNDEVDFQEMIIFENPTNHTIELEIGIPLTWPFDINKTQISYEPFQKWSNIDKNSIVYTDQIPGIPHIPLIESMEGGSKTGISLKTIVSKGMLSENNGTYSLKLLGVVEAGGKEAEIKIPVKKTTWGIFSYNLKISNSNPLYADEWDEGNYHIFHWDEFFLTYYHTGFGKNLTSHDITILYSYEFDPDFILGIFTGIFSSVIFAVIVYIFKRVSRKKS